MGKSVIRKKINAKGARASGGGGGGGVTSFNGRTGAVSPAVGDYPVLATVDYFDIASGAAAGTLIEGQLYTITNFPGLFTSGIELVDPRFYAYYDTAAANVVMANQGMASFSTDATHVYQTEVWLDWYGTGFIELVYDLKSHNLVEGYNNIDIFPFGSSTVSYNKVAKNFNLDLTNLTTELFTDNICYGDGAFLAKVGRDYIGIDFTKGYFITYGNISQNTTNDPTLEIFKNESGGTITSTRQGAGEYRITCSISSFGAAVTDTWIHIGNSPVSVQCDSSASWANDTVINLYTAQFATGVDDGFVDTPFEIRVKF